MGARDILDFMLLCRLGTFLCYFGLICIKFVTNLAFKFQKFYAQTAPFNCAIWDKFSDQHWHQSTKKHYIECSISTFLNANKVQIKCIF